MKGFSRECFVRHTHGLFLFFKKFECAAMNILTIFNASPAYARRALAVAVDVEDRRLTTVEAASA